MTDADRMRGKPAANSRFFDACGQRCPRLAASARNGGQTLALRGRCMPICSVDLNPDVTRTVTGYEDNTVKVWDAKRGADLEGGL